MEGKAMLTDDPMKGVRKEERKVMNKATLLLTRLSFIGIDDEFNGKCKGKWGLSGTLLMVYGDLEQFKL